MSTYVIKWIGAPSAAPCHTLHSSKGGRCGQPATATVPNPGGTRRWCCPEHAGVLATHRLIAEAGWTCEGGNLRSRFYVRASERKELAPTG